jgi:hypothetical protein
MLGYCTHTRRRRCEWIVVWDSVNASQGCIGGSPVLVEAVCRNVEAKNKEDTCMQSSDTEILMDVAPGLRSGFGRDGGVLYLNSGFRV